MASTISKTIYGILVALALMLPFITVVSELKANYPDIQGDTSYTGNLTVKLDTSLGNLNKTTSELYDKISNPQESTPVDIFILLGKTVTTALNIIVIQLPTTVFLWVTTILEITGLSAEGRIFALIVIAVLLAIVFFIIRTSTRSDV